MKKLFAVVQLIGVVGLGFGVVHAQTSSMVGMPAPTLYPYPGPNPAPTPVPPNSGFIQFDNLVVQSVSAGNPPAEIVASSNIYPLYPMGASGVIMPGMTPASASAVSPQAFPQKLQIRGQATLCYQFNTRSDSKAAPIACPAPAVTPNAANPAASNATAPNSAGIMLPPSYNSSYRIEVDASTRLSLRDRTTAGLSDISNGDQINVFGYYNPDGSIQAYLVRDISKPAITQTIQLNNVTIASISTTSTPATITVTENRGPICNYGEGSAAPGAGVRIPIYPCPLGASVKTQTGLQAPGPAQPNYILTRQYVVTVDARTILLDRNRTQLTLASLKTGDTVNVYGVTDAQGTTVSADIVRDLAIPPVAADYSGTVTQVNADGSFALLLSNGQTVTVQNPITAQATVTVHGLLDGPSNTISQVSRMFIGNTFSTPPYPVPLPMTPSK